ncbi:hypothetical protein K7A41_03040 [Sphingobacterium sp. InxBP1]|uniref:hypothetical protein n=1 Tax=Sphingobacterium sp. InxBP1 TaxID=2870328 RepID=UPI0022447418|nr:hypothetical protein [Sphingobacterium sp. InxBP1]MCW8310194.1 hypothetical protein [Sphingobacterium sp. InxBP1]
MSTSKGIQRKELEEGSVIRNFRITASDGKHYNAQHDNLSAIVAFGYTVNLSVRYSEKKWYVGNTDIPLGTAQLRINAYYPQTIHCTFNCNRIVI